MTQNKITLTGWELFHAHPVLINIARQRLVTCKASYNLNKIIKLADKIIHDEKFYDRNNEIIKKYSKKSEDPNAQDKIVLDPEKMEIYMKEADEFLAKDYVVEYSPVNYMDLENTGLQLSMEELGLVEKFIII